MLGEGPLGAERRSNESRGSWMGVRGGTRSWGGDGKRGQFCWLSLVVRVCGRGQLKAGPGGLDQLRGRVRGLPGGLAGKLLGSLNTALGLKAPLIVRDSELIWQSWW